MIPARLKVKNFMCYGEDTPALDFEAFQVACLCGDNGHGKSALLDAITWALWGKARGAERRDWSQDELIRLGEAEMEVDFEFYAGESRYRVVRKRARPRPRRAGQTSLDLLVASGDGPRVISGNSIAETERQIIDILRMDYKTFINSALLLQGRADEFTVKRTGDRKDVLAYILDLSLYSEFEERARRAARERETERYALDKALADIDAEMAHRGEYLQELQQAEETLVGVEQEVAGLEPSLAALRALVQVAEARRQECQELEKRLDRDRQQVQFLERHLAQCEARIQKYERVLSAYPEELASLQARQAQLVAAERRLADARKQAEEISNRAHYLRTANERLKAEMRDLEGKIKLLGTGEESARCPLCQTDLGPEGRERIIERYGQEGKEKGDAYRAHQKEAEEKERALEGLRREVADFERSVDAERRWCHSRLDSLSRERQEAEDAFPSEREARQQAADTLARLKQTLVEEAARREALKAELSGLPQQEEDLRRQERAVQQLQQRERAARERLASARERLRRCAELDAARVQRLQQRERTAAERGIYDELAAAFGKKGIQALLIEAAIPEIEEEATRLLARMTDNRMHLRIETQRAVASKKGEVEETLDIKISDELGTRNYEMFSGGEAFRVNFALRVALSKLLARRAGAPLPTLIIDEGFGTQDSSGREKVREAISSIQDDFQKILVITHIEELKDDFPVRIEVIKTPAGSTFSVVGV